MVSFILSGIVTGLAVTRSWQPDISVAFFGIPSGPISYMLKRFRGIPYVVSLRGGDVPGHQPEQLASFHAVTRPFIRFLWRQAAAVVANSAGLKRLAEKTAPAKPVRQVANGVDTNFFRPGSAPRANEGPPVLLFVGRVSYEKGLQHLMPALARIGDAPWVLHLVGDGPYMPQVNAMIRGLNLGGRVSCFGWVGKDALVRLYQDADVFVFPSSHEGMPNSILEAMACGLPVVATRISGSEELVEPERSGLLVPPEDIDALARALRVLLLGDGVRRREMGRAGHSIAAEHYTWRRAAQAYLEIMRPLTLRPPSPNT